MFPLLSPAAFSRRANHHAQKRSDGEQHATHDCPTPILGGPECEATEVENQKDNEPNCDRCNHFQCRRGTQNSHRALLLSETRLGNSRSHQRSWSYQEQEQSNFNCDSRKAAPKERPVLTP